MWLPVGLAYDNGAKVACGRTGQGGVSRFVCACSMQKERNKEQAASPHVATQEVTEHGCCTPVATHR